MWLLSRSDIITSLPFSTKHCPILEHRTRWRISPVCSTALMNADHQLTLSDVRDHQWMLGSYLQLCKFTHTIDLIILTFNLWSTPINNPHFLHGRIISPFISSHLYSLGRAAQWNPNYMAAYHYRYVVNWVNWPFNLEQISVDFLCVAVCVCVTLTEMLLWLRPVVQTPGGSQSYYLAPFVCRKQTWMLRSLYSNDGVSQPPSIHTRASVK